MELKFDIFGAQIDGARDYQEDTFLTTQLGHEGNANLLIVADGMGGHAAGNVASNLAVQAFNQSVSENFPTDNIPEMLMNAMTQANNAISDTIKATQALKGMGCTLVAALCVDNKLYWISVGDSHLFHLSGDAIFKKNDDHSYGGYLDRMAEEGKEVELQSGYSRNMLLSALTGEDIPAVDCPDTPTPLKPNDRILLCSDGIDSLEQQALLQFSQECGSAKDTTERLLIEVMNVGVERQDNTTIVAAEYGDFNAASLEKTAEPMTSNNSNVLKEPTTYASEGVNTDNTMGKWILLLLLFSCAGIGGWWYFTQGQQKTEIAYELEEATDESEMINATTEPVVEEIIELEEPATEPEVEIEAEVEIETAIEPIIADKKATEHPPLEFFNDNLSSGGSAPKMVWIPAGAFTMGSLLSSPPADERPSHQVSVKKFAISIKEITQGDFAKYTGHSVPKKEQSLPVRKISWYAAKKYVEWLSKKTGKKYRLPSEAEWEYAAKAGTSTIYWWGNDIGNENAVCFGCGVPLEPIMPKATGSFKANAFGLFDSAGNVAEWTEDCYHPNYKQAPVDGSVWDKANCKMRVVRGGSYFNASKSLSVTKRTKKAANRAYEYIGFRVVREG